MITEKTIFTTRGEQFDSLEAAEAFRASLFGDLLDKCPAFRTIGLTARLAIVDFLAENRAALSELSDY